MAGDTIITVIGNLTGDPELRFTPSGAAVANFTVASTPRAFDRDSGEWKDQDALFMRCSVWRDAAENVAESLRRGHRVIVSGRLKQRSFETKEGEKRTVIELDVEEIGASLKWTKVTVPEKAPRAGGGQAPQGGDPWAGAPQGQAPQGQGQGPRGGAPQGGPRGRGPGDPQGGPPTHQGYGQTRPDGAQQGGSPWAENPQGQLPAQQGGGSAPGWGAPGQPTYQEPPF